MAEQEAEFNDKYCHQNKQGRSAMERPGSLVICIVFGGDKDQTKKL